MKKLMKAVAAAAVALVASSSFAELQTIAGFENFQAGALTIGTIVSVEDNGAQGDARYWFAITNDSVATTGETIGNIVEDSGNKYLALEAQAPLYRTVKPSGDAGAALVVNDPQTIGDGIYLDTMVKFTISQDAFKDGDLEDNVDKLAITCYSAEESTDTNILVRAGYVSGQTITPTNYFLNLSADFDADAWHRLTVRAIAGVGSETAPVGFAIYLDQTLLTYDVSVAAGDATYEAALNAAVVNNLYNGTTHALLPSLVRGTFNDATTLSAVGFKGTGCLDNVAFTNEKPGFIVEGQSVSITWDAGVATYKVVDSKGVTMIDDEAVSGVGSTNLTLDADIEYLTVTATYAEGYEAGDWNGNFTVENGATLNIRSMVPMFDVGGTHYGTFADALENATGAEGSPATIKFLADYTGDIEFDQNTVNYIVLDLAGRTLTGDADAAIHTGCANLTITNSTETIGHVVAPAEGLAVVCEADSALTVNAGIFDGEIADDSGYTATIAINAGTFYDPYYVAEPTNDFYLKGNVPEGVTISAPSNGYFTVGEQPIIGTFEVTVTPTENATYTVTGAASQSENVVTVAVGQTITITATPAWNYEYATTHTGWTAGQDGAITIDVNLPGTVVIPAPTALSGWGFYLGRPVDGAYTIDNVADLNKLREGVAAGVATANVTFKQTANIDMQNEVAFAGIGTYAKVPTAGTPFLGTYDGQGFKISNVTRAGENTQGIFNQVGPSGVIENLVVENMVFDSSVSGEYGFAIVGNAGGGATLRNLTAAGTFGSASKPSTHNMAGIVVRLSPGATAGAATTIDSCTNNATIYGGYTKLGGINAIVQDQTGFKDGKVVFVNCANNGTLVCKRTATDVTGNAGIVGYIAGTNVELTGCYGNGAITNNDGANTDKDGALVGWTYGGTITDNGGNAAPAGKKMIGTWGSATETGFLYATVADDVATTISGSIAAGNTYLLEGDAAPTIELAAKDDTIAFDTALGYTLTDTGITAGSGLEVTSNTVGTVTTYKAAEPAPVTPTIDPANPAAVEVKAADADAAIAAVALETPTGVDAAEYKALFDITATETSAGSGVYSVEVTGIKESVEEDVEESAMDVLDGKLGAKVQVPAGLYYKITTYTELGGTAVDTVGGSEISDGTGVSVTKPGTTQGFIKIEMAPKAIN